MHLITSSALTTVSLLVSSATHAAGIQPYEAGTAPIRARIEVIAQIIVAIKTRLEAPALSSEEKDVRGDCLQQYLTEKKQLEEDLEAGRKISQSPWLTYLTEKTEQECTKGLLLPPNKQPVASVDGRQ